MQQKRGLPARVLGLKKLRKVLPEPRLPPWADAEVRLHSVHPEGGVPAREKVPEGVLSVLSEPGVPTWAEQQVEMRQVRRGGEALLHGGASHHAHQVRG